MEDSATLFSSVMLVVPGPIHVLTDHSLLRSLLSSMILAPGSGTTLLLTQPTSRPLSQVRVLSCHHRLQFFTSTSDGTGAPLPVEDLSREHSSGETSFKGLKPLIYTVASVILLGFIPAQQLLLSLQ
ncbi:hypothetical protein GBAR_LOCUS30383 [Geodia barretti]|uniref:Uncharacterized protein n=1 Tax=Geodia barretti TaxID=519541 RepID=A0AA35TXY0_GEOBA|nr:hypothetical protein GBAR_LOCUS30383 [Geodia barretti]